MSFQFQLSPKKVQTSNKKDSSQKKHGRGQKHSQVSFEDLNYKLSSAEKYRPKNEIPSPKSKASTGASPSHSEKFKRHFSLKLMRLMEENMALKKRNDELKIARQHYVDTLGYKEQVNRTKVCLANNASKELGAHVSKFDDMRVNLFQLDMREQFQEKNLRGLINYAKKLTLELDDFKSKVQMAERII